MKQPTSYYTVGESRTSADNAITSMFGTFILGFEVDAATETVLDFSCSHTVELTEKFLKRIFIGENFPGIDGWIEDTLRHYYGGTSRKAIVASYRDALKRYNTMRADG